MKARMLHSRLAAITLCFRTLVTALAQSDGKWDPERLRELEEIVRQRVQAGIVYSLF